MNDNYIKALSVQNIAKMVYAMQLHCELGMPPGIHLGSIYDEEMCIRDRSHTGYGSAVCGAVQHSVVWLSNAMRSLVGLCIARQGVRAPAGIGPVGCLP